MSSGPSMPTAPVQLVVPARHADGRGWFSETYNQATFRSMGIATEFMQDNHSLSVPAYTLRGLHFQLPPFAQAKLVRCIRGRIFDVAVDIRRTSPTFGHWVASELSAENGHQLFLPVGFAHGFLTLEPDCEVIYKCSAFYAPEHESGFVWNDPDAAINWPLPEGQTPELSAKDQRLPPLSQLNGSFDYDGRPLKRVAQTERS